MLVSRAIVLHIQALVLCTKEFWLGVWRSRRRQCCLNLFFRKMHTWHNFTLFVLQDEHFMLIFSAVGGILNLKMGCFALGKVFFNYEHFGGVFFFFKSSLKHF